MLRASCSPPSATEATTRQIAQHAGVALGTVFNYATTKRDLLFLVSNDLLDEARALAATSPRPSRSLARISSRSVPIVDTLRTEVTQALASPDTRDRLKSVDTVPISLSTEASGEWLSRQPAEVDRRHHKNEYPSQLTG